MTAHRPKLHLVARAPNEGARRLARWILLNLRGDMTAAAEALHLSIVMVDRLLTEDIRPGDALAARITLATEGEIVRKDWQVPAQANWFGPMRARAGRLMPMPAKRGAAQAGAAAQ